jgi:hypothetical protein
MGLADFVHDGAWRDAMVAEMRKGGQSYSADEAGLIAQVTELLNSLTKGAGKARPIKSHAKTVEVAQTKYDKSSGMVVGEVKLLVPASPEEIIAFLMHLDSKFYQSKLNPKVDVRFEVLEVKSLHCSIVFYEIKTAPIRNRIATAPSSSQPCGRSSPMRHSPTFGWRRPSGATTKSL